MLIDCNDCVMQNSDACGDCIVTVLLNNPVDGQQSDCQMELDDAEAMALGNLAAAGLVAEMRLLKKTGSD